MVCGCCDVTTFRKGWIRQNLREANLRQQIAEQRRFDSRIPEKDRHMPTKYYDPRLRDADRTMFETEYRKLEKSRRPSDMAWANALAKSCRDKAKTCGAGDSVWFNMMANRFDGVAEDVISKRDDVPIGEAGSASISALGARIRPIRFPDPPQGAYLPRRK
jgi:hypothetical protein